MGMPVHSSEPLRSWTDVKLEKTLNLLCQKKKKNQKWKYQENTHLAENIGISRLHYIYYALHVHDW